MDERKKCLDAQKRNAAYKQRKNNEVGQKSTLRAQ